MSNYYSIERMREECVLVSEDIKAERSMLRETLQEYVRPRLSVSGQLEIIESLRNSLKTSTASKGWWFITIRPDTDKICFFDFWTEVKKMLHTTLYSEYYCSFEQKSLTAPLGLGFHCHIIAKSSYWKSQQLQKLSKFQKWCNPACIHIEKCFDHINLLNSYLISYASDDEHKSVTQEPDKRWREEWGMKHIYQHPRDWLHSLSSPQ